MPTVNFTSALRRFFPNLEADNFEGKTVQEILNNIEKKYPNITDYLIDEEGKLRKHINVFIGESMIQDRIDLSDIVREEQEILIFQALSGG